MPTFRKALLVLAALVAAILLYAAGRPDNFRIERSLVMHATPERIYPLISDLHQWQHWSPWEKLDPKLQRSYEGSGQGASYAWSGNDKVGSGSMTITALQPGQRIVLALHFIQPFEASNQAEFTLTPEAGGTRVSWAMTGPNPYLAKVMQIFFDMDAMVGKDFESGLDNLRRITEQ